MAAASIIIWGFVGVGLFSGAAAMTLVSKVFDAFAKQPGICQSCAIWTQRLAAALTLLLIIAVLTATPLLVLRVL